MMRNCICRRCVI